MRHRTGLAAVLAGAALLAGCGREQPLPAEPESGQAPPAQELGSEQERYSYAIGFQVGSSLRERVADIDTGALARGVEDGLGDAAPRLTDEEMQTALQAYDRLQQEKLTARAEAAAEEGRAFLESNRKQEGVQTTESGLQYRVLEEGTGEQPDVNDTVVVHYRGTLLNGEEFDSSYARGEPARFPVGAVIPGWQEALQMMPEGAKWKVWIPPQLAYGERGAGDVIGPNETLVFEIELLEIVGEASSQAPAQGTEGR